MTAPAPQCQPMMAGLPGPCVICGDTNYSLSCGGPEICPKCDCGHFDNATVMKQSKAIASLRARVGELTGALAWALPLADLALEAHRMERLRCGHTMSFQKSDGATWVGLSQDEWDARERSIAALNTGEGE